MSEAEQPRTALVDVRVLLTNPTEALRFTGVLLGPSPIMPGPWVPGAVQPSLDQEFTPAATCGMRMPRDACEVVTDEVRVPRDGTAFHGLDFRNRIFIDGGTAALQDCYLGGAKQESGTAQLVCHDPEVTSVLADFCHFVPDEPQAGCNGVIGHHWTVRRSVVGRTQDGLGSYVKNGALPRTDNHLEGSYVYKLAWWHPDPLGIQDDGSHCEPLQHQGQKGLWVVGNTLRGFIEAQDGSDMTDSPSGTPPNYNQSGQILMVQDNTGAIGDIHVLTNWIYGGANGMVFRGIGDGQDHVVEVKRNRWMDNKQKTGNHVNYIRCDDNTVLDLGDGPKAYRNSVEFYDMPGGEDANVWGFTGEDALGNPVAEGEPIKDGVRVP